MTNGGYRTITPSKIRSIAASVLRETLSCFHECDEIRVETSRYGVRVAYASSFLSRGSRNATCLECRADYPSNDMWVDRLHVADSLRFNGIGRQLTMAAERLAWKLGLQTMKVFPLVSAGIFWNKMGYSPDPKSARVVTKNLARTGTALSVEHAKLPGSMQT